MKIISFGNLAPERLDRKTATVYGVAVCTEGPARGHGLMVDSTTLEQLLDSAEAKGKVPCKLDHKSGIGQVCGYLTDFWIDGDKLRANWQLLKNQPNFGHTWELIENLHDTCGLSCSFSGQSEDGRARCKDLISVDFVAHPATGNGLFSRGDLEEETDNESEENMTNNKTTNAELVALMHELLDHVEAIEAENAQLREALDALQDDEDESEDDDEQEEPVLDERGARRGPYQYETLLPVHTVDFAARVEHFQAKGSSPKEAHISALKELARQQFGDAPNA